jgi:O-antigen/teichoic acid export membrane protein
MEYKKFAKDVVWISVGQLFVSLILGILILPALTKSYTPEIYGIWIQVNVTVDLVSPLLSLQFGLAAVRFLAGQEDVTKRRQFLGSMLFGITVFACLVSLAGIPFVKQLSVLLFANPAHIVYIWLVLMWTFINTIYNFLLSYLQARSKNREISFNQMAITIAKVMAIVGLANAGASLGSIIFCMVALQVAFSFGLLIIIIREIGFPMPNLTGLRTFLTYSVPQIPGVILLWVIRMSDRYFITHFLGLSQNGIYSSSITLASLASLFYFPVSFVLFSLTSRLWEQKRFEDVKSYFDYSLRLFLTLALPGAVGISILSQPLLKLLTTSQFLAGKELVFLATFGIILFGIYQINTNLVLLSKRVKFLPLVAFAGSIISVLMNIILIPRIGIMGAAISSCVSYFTLALIATLWARKIVYYTLNFRYLGKVIASTLVMLVCLNFLKVDNIGSIILAVFVGAIVFGAVLLLLRAFSDQDKQLVKRTLGHLIPFVFNWK